MSDDMVVTDARIIERVEAGKPLAAVRMRLPEVVLWTVIATALYGVVRVIVAGAFALPWLAAPPTPAAASLWMLLGTPAAMAVAAFLTMQTNTRNRELHTMTTFVVFASAVVFHLNLAIGNAYLAQAATATWVFAWAFQAVAVVAGGLAGMAVVRLRRARRTAGGLALPAAE